MAEATGLRNNALPYPVYGAPWTVIFPILDADGDLVTGASSPDSEVSKNGDTFADCTNEATEIATTSGMYYLTLTATEMTADIVAVIVKTSTSGAKTTPIVLYPRKLITLASGTSQGGASGYITLAAGAVTYDDQFNGCLCVGTLDSAVEARVLQDCTASNQQCTVTPNWNTTPDADDTYVIYLPEGMQVPTPNVIRIAGMAAVFIGTDGGVLVSFDNTFISANDGKALISSDVQDRSETLSVNDPNRVSIGDITSMFAATDAELAKVPKSDSNVSWNATALAAINAEVDGALNTAIPGSPTADSINERVATMDTSVALMRLLIATGAVVDDNDPDPTATVFETNLTEATNDHYNGAFLVFTSGALLDQSRKITGYVGATKVITTSAFTEAPAGGDTFAILGRSE